MKVSFILPTKDRPRMLPNMIASVLVQTDPNWELIVFDNGETSIENLMPRDRRAYYFRGKASGPADASRQAMAHATGDIIMPISDDDTIAPDTVETILDRIGDAEWGYARTAWQRDGETIFLLGSFWDLDALKHGYYLGGAVFWRKSFSDRIGTFDPEFDGAGDYDLYLRFGMAAEPVYIRNKILYYYNDWAGTDSRQQTDRQVAMNEKIWSKYR